MSTDIFKVTEHTAPAGHIREYPGSTARSQEEVLSLHVKQYTPLDQNHSIASDAITVIAAHACGYPKVSLTISNYSNGGMRALWPWISLNIGNRTD